MVRIYLSYKSHEARRRVKVGESWKRKSQARPGVSRLRVKGGSGAKSCMRRGGRKRRPFFFSFFLFFFHLLGQRIPHYVISFREEDGTKSIC